MGRILAFDYGQKRVGIAVTDPLKIIANGLDTIRPIDTWEFLEKYCREEKIECFVIGMPKNLNNQPSEAVKFIKPFIKKLREKYPDIPVHEVDERFTSKMAFQAMIDGGVKKMQRRDKALIDKVSATIILQHYLETIKK